MTELETKLFNIAKTINANQETLVLRNPADREHSFWLNVNTDSGSS